MKHLIGIGMLIAMAFGLRSWLQTSLALDIFIHDTYLGSLSQDHRLLVPKWELRLLGSWFLRGHRFVAIPNFPATIASKSVLVQLGPSRISSQDRRPIEPARVIGNYKIYMSDLRVYLR